MSDEIALRKAMDLGAKAEIELNAPAVSDAFKALEAKHVLAWRNSDPRDNEGRELSWLALKALDGVRAELMAAINDGKIAKAELDQGDPLGR